MTYRIDIKLARASALIVGILVLAGCARTNRVAALNRETPGATVATSLQRELSVKGYPSARVICKKSLVINVGAVETCALTGAGANGTVRFSFRNYTGKLLPASVIPSS